jgi:Family of unknown function (DUF6404)
MASLKARTDFFAKRDIALRLMTAKGIRWRAAPPIYHAFWACGVRIRPPLFSSFLFNLTYQATLCAIFLGLMTFVLTLLGELNSVSRLVVVAVVIATSVLLGLMGALEFRYFARKYNLPSWSDLQDEAQVFD